jgi:hypothetical protein
MMNGKIPNYRGFSLLRRKTINCEPTRWSAVPAILCLTLLQSIAGASANQTNETCTLPDFTKTEFYSTSDTYAFLREIDAIGGCSRLTLDDFDELTNDLELNLVSYTLLEERLVTLEQRYVNSP